MEIGKDALIGSARRLSGTLLLILISASRHISNSIRAPFGHISGSHDPFEWIGWKSVFRTTSLHDGIT